MDENAPVALGQAKGEAAGKALQVGFREQDQKDAWSEFPAVRQIYFKQRLFKPACVPTMVHAVMKLSIIYHNLHNMVGCYRTKPPLEQICSYRGNSDNCNGLFLMARRYFFLYAKEFVFFISEKIILTLIML